MSFPLGQMVMITHDPAMIQVGRIGVVTGPPQICKCWRIPLLGECDPVLRPRFEAMKQFTGVDFQQIKTMDGGAGCWPITWMLKHPPDEEPKERLFEPGVHIYKGELA